MNILCFVRPYPDWDRRRFDLRSGRVEVPAESPVGMSAFGEGTWTLRAADRAAIDVAAALAAADGSGRLTAVALEEPEPDAAEAALREALARGATDALLVTGAEEADAFVASGVLAAVCARQAPLDLVVLAAETPAGLPDEIAPMLAEALGWAQVTRALRLARTPAGFQAEQEWIGGRRTVQTAGPLVVSLLPEPAQPPRYPRPAAIAAAFTAPIETLAADAVAPDAPLVPAVQVRRAALAEALPVERLAGPLDESVAVLTQALRQLGYGAAGPAAPRP